MVWWINKHKHSISNTTLFHSFIWPKIQHEIFLVWGIFFFFFFGGGGFAGSPRDLGGWLIFAPICASLSIQSTHPLPTPQGFREEVYCSSYFFVVIVFPFTIFVDVDVDLKFPKNKTEILEHCSYNITKVSSSLRKLCVCVTSIFGFHSHYQYD